jgi:hypothetical protein
MGKDKMIMKDELGTIWMKAAVALFKHLKSD